MKKKSRQKSKNQFLNGLLIAIALIVLFLVYYYFAYIRIMPSPPSSESVPSIQQFYGNISLPNGTLISSAKVYAIVNGTLDVSATSVNGEYGYAPLFLIENAKEGNKIEFYINYSEKYVKVKETSFQNFNLTRLDLVLSYCGDGFCISDESCSSCSSDCGACPPPPPPGGSCFPVGTKITMADGSQTNIEDVKIGDDVLSYDFSSSKKTASKVLELESPVRNQMCELIFNSGSLKLTAEHPVYSSEGWKSIAPEETARENNNLRVGKLGVDDVVMGLKENKKVLSINCWKEEVRTYNLKQVENNNYYADGILVHNKGDSGCTPACTGKTCGAADGCSGKCVVQTCGTGKICSSAGLCVLANCTPNCQGKVCGDNGCGGSCGSCASGKACSNGICQTCTESCSSLGFNCGIQNICGQQISCGACGTNESCTNGLCKITQTPQKKYNLLIVGLIILILAVLAVLAIVIINIVKHRTHAYIIIFFFVVIIFFFLSKPSFVGNVINNPPSINQFYGTILKNGASYDGLMEAKIDGASIASINSKNGRYGFEPLFIIQDIEENKLIEFFVDGNKAGEARFSNFEFTELNLAFSTGSSSDGGSSGGSSGGGGIINPSPANNNSNNQINENQPVPENNNTSDKPAKYKGLAGFAVLDDTGKGMWFGLIAVIALVAIIIIIVIARKHENAENKK